MVSPLLALALLAQSVTHSEIPNPALGDPATAIPITTFTGARPGKTLVITCGVHGFEFVPILAAQRLLTAINPQQLTGRVILVRLAHPPAFARRTLHLNPHDGLNLNRVFPGNPNGSQSQRIAHALSQLIAEGDFHIDMHGGDGNELLDAFVGTYGGPLAATQFPTSDRMARAFGLPRIVDYRMETWEQVNSGRSCNRQAVAAGKPTILVEIGQQGRAEASEVALATRGVINVLRALEMLPGAPLLNRRQPLRYDGTVGVSFTQTGIWYPAVTPGTAVTTGQTLGAVRSLTGELLEEIKAPAPGVVLYMTAAPPVNAGESALTIARPQATTRK